MSKRKKHAPRIPISVTGGIRAQTGRGRHVRRGWGARWMALIEKLVVGPRLGRGRSYAASGQVAELQPIVGAVEACVQGASPQPYRVALRFRTLDEAGPRKVLSALLRRPILGARLLVRDLPPEVEELFCAAGCPLVPEQREDLRVECSCPDWSELCKHATAVSYLLAEAIDRDPLLLLALRGIGRDELLGHRAAESRSADQQDSCAAEAPLSADPAAFWGSTSSTEETPTDFGPAPDCAGAAPLARRLGPLPFWRGEEKFLDVLCAVCARAAPRGWTVWSGEPLDLSRAGAKTPAPSGVFRLRRHRLNMDLTLQ